jgi:transcriptional regulator with GAF, ATPase, and Fis domain
MNTEQKEDVLQSEFLPDDEWIPLDSLARGAEKFAGMVIQSAASRKLVNTVSRLGPHKTTVLIQGESGTGKELVARALHTLGPTPKGPFVSFNCSNLVGSLAEAQLFGHVRGAFTDAREDALGYFRSADGGTLFLDEVGELPLSLQPKLLRAVETHEVQPVGSTKGYMVDIRLIAATNRDLLAMVKARQFRDDLYYRMSATNIRVAPLRERRDGIAALTAHFIDYCNDSFGKQIRLISAQALELLQTNEWRGNVREFANAIQNAVMLADTDRLSVTDFSDIRQGGDAAMQLPNISKEAEGNERLSVQNANPLLSRDEAIKAALIRALRETGDNCHRTAQLLGVSRYTVYRMIARHGLVRDSTHRNRGLHLVSKEDPRHSTAH